MRFDRSFAASALLHALILGIGLVGFGVARPMIVAPTESLPIDILSTSEFSEMTRGQKTAPKAERPRQRVEKIGDPKPVEREAKKISEKAPVGAVEAPPQPPKVERPPEPEKKAEAKPEEPKESLKPEPKKEPEPKAAEPPPKPPQRPKVLPPKPPVQTARSEPQQKFDPNAIAALLDKRTPTRQAATGEELSQTASLGTATGAGAMIRQNAEQALAARLRELWQQPMGDRVVRFALKFSFNPDGTFARTPELLEISQNDASSYAVAQTAVRAAISGQPFAMLPRGGYENWKVVTLAFCTPEVAIECTR